MNIILITILSIFYSCNNSISNYYLTPISMNFFERNTSVLSKNILTGKENPNTIQYFVKVKSEYCLYGDQYLHKQAYNAYIDMYKHAQEEGIELKILSSHRTYYTQNWLWETNWEKNRNKFTTDSACVKNMLDYLSIPGTSRHHWGTDIDILSVSPEYFTYGKGLEALNWLNKNAKTYGYYLSYTPNREVGYNYEPWHWSYAPLSRKYLKQYIETITIEDLGNIKGISTIHFNEIINEYVLGINPELLPSEFVD